MSYHNKLGTLTSETWMPRNDKKEWAKIAKKLTNLFERYDMWMLASHHQSELVPTPTLISNIHLVYEAGIEPVRFGDSPQGNSWCLYISTNSGVFEHYFSALESDVNFLLNLKEDRTIEILEGHWEHRQFITEGYKMYAPQN